MSDPADVIQAHVLGHVVWLMSKTQTHKDLKVSEVERYIFPAIIAGQYHLFFNTENHLIGFALWAEVDDQVDSQLRNNYATGLPTRLHPGAWRSGHHLWLMELVSPFATPENNLLYRLMGEWARYFFPERSFTCIRMNPEKRVMELVQLRAADLPTY